MHLGTLGCVLWELSLHNDIVSVLHMLCMTQFSHTPLKVKRIYSVLIIITSCLRRRFGLFRMSSGLGLDAELVIYSYSVLNSVWMCFVGDHSCHHQRAGGPLL